MSCMSLCVISADSDTAVAASAALELIFPDGMTMFSCDYGTLALWDGNSASGFLASLTIDLSTAFVSSCTHV